MKKTLFMMLAMGAINEVSATQSSPELIRNGEFCENSCKQDWCISKQKDFVKGWIPDPEIEVGYGNIYSDSLGKERVVQLAPNCNSCIKQSIPNLKAGSYQLKFEWGARKGRNFDDSKFEVYFDGKKIKSLNPCDYKVHTETIDIDIKADCQNQEIKFCAVGTANSYGAFIKSVSLRKKPVVSNPKPVDPPVPSYPYPNPPIYNPPVVNPPVYNPPVYNPPVVTPPGIYLESHSGQCLQRQFFFENSQYEIQFDYRLMSTVQLRESAIYLTFNGEPIHRVLPCDDGKSIKVPFTPRPGKGVLGFCAVGSSNEPKHTAYLNNINVFRRQCVGKWSNDLIVNGGFQQNCCQSSWCLWNHQNFQSSNVPGWIPSPEIQVGKANVYTKVLGNSWVSQLDPNANSCIKQKVNLKPGKHVLEFDWASRQGITKPSNAFEVRINGQVLKSFTPCDYNAHNEKIEFTLESCPQESYIEFCGKGTSDSYGALIDNVKLFQYDECASWSILKC